MVSFADFASPFSFSPRKKLKTYSASQVNAIATPRRPLSWMPQGDGSDDAGSSVDQEQRYQGAGSKSVPSPSADTDLETPGNTEPEKSGHRRTNVHESATPAKKSVHDNGDGDDDLDAPLPLPPSTVLSSAQPPPSSLNYATPADAVPIPGSPRIVVEDATHDVAENVDYDDNSGAYGTTGFYKVKKIVRLVNPSARKRARRCLVAWEGTDPDTGRPWADTIEPLSEMPDDVLAEFEEACRNSRPATRTKKRKARS